MKLLEQLISSLDQEKSVSFIKSIQNIGSNNQGVELELYLSIRNNKDLKATNQNAYHSNRKRLVKKLIEFIHINQIEDEDSGKSIIDTYLSTAKYLFRNNAEKSAWNLLSKAEDNAQKDEAFEKLNQVYLIQIEFSISRYAPTIESIIKKQEENKVFQQLEERMKIGAKVIESELQKIILTGENEQFDNIINRVSKSLNLTEGILTNPKFAYRFLSMSRNISKAQKAYHQFEPFVIQTYETLIAGNAFKEKHIYYELSILYMICHSLYRVRDFKTLKPYLQSFEKLYNQGNQTIQKQFESKLILLKASSKALNNELEDAISILNQKYESFKVEDEIVLNLNLGLYHFMNKEHKLALKTNQTFGHSEKWMEKKLGLEWVMKKQLMEIIIHYDLENLDLVESLIRSFETKFRALLNLPKYITVKPFMGFIKSGLKAQIIDINKIEEVLTQTPKAEEDLQGMIFYAWLKAKVQKKNFYETVLEMMNEKSPIA